MSIADTLLPYKGYVATIEYDADEDLLQGHVGEYAGYDRVLRRER